MTFEELSEQYVADNVESNFTSEVIAIDSDLENSDTNEGPFLEEANSPTSHTAAVAAAGGQNVRIAPKTPHQDDLLVALKMLLFEACRFHKVEGYRQGVMAVVKQLDQLWLALEGSQEQKYEFLRARIQALFLWDRTTNGLRRDLLCPPQEMLEVFHRQRANRLRALPDGSLFFPSSCVPTSDVSRLREEHRDAPMSAPIK